MSGISSRQPKSAAASALSMATHGMSYRRGCRIGDWGMRAEALVAPGGQLRKRHRVARPAAGRVNTRGRPPAARAHLRQQQCREIRGWSASRAWCPGRRSRCSFSGRRRRCAFTQNAKMPWSGVPNCPAPASTPQRLIHTGNPKAAPYSSAMISDASLVRAIERNAAARGEVARRYPLAVSTPAAAAGVDRARIARPVSRAAAMPASSESNRRGWCSAE